MKKITVNGIQYSSITAAANKHNIPYDTVVTRLNNGWTPEQAFGYEPPKTKVGNSKSITINGVTYDSKREAQRVYNKVPYCTAITRLNNGWTPEQAFGLVKRDPKLKNNIKKGIKPKNNKIIVDNKEFESLSKACKYYNKNYSRIERRLHRGWTTDEAFGIVIERLGEIKLHGRVFDSFEEAVKAYNLNIYFIYNELRNGKSLSEAFHIRNNDALIINGKKCKYIENALAKLTINHNIYMNRLRKGWFIEEIIEGKRLYSTDKYYELDGKRFKSLSDIAKYYNMSKDILYSRYIRGWTLKEAVEGKRKKVKKK